MARLAVICFLLALCNVVTSANRYPVLSRTDNSTVILGTIQDTVTIEIEGATKTVNEFLKLVEEGRKDVKGPYADLKISTVTKIHPWCATDDTRDFKETKEPTRIQDPVQTTNEPMSIPNLDQHVEVGPLWHYSPWFGTKNGFMGSPAPVGGQWPFPPWFTAGYQGNWGEDANRPSQPVLRE